MVSGKRVADVGYKIFTSSMVLLTAYGGYLCSVRAYHFYQYRVQQRLAAENQDPKLMKD